MLIDVKTFHLTRQISLLLYRSVCFCYMPLKFVLSKKTSALVLFVEVTTNCNIKMLISIISRKKGSLSLVYVNSIHLRKHALAESSDGDRIKSKFPLFIWYPSIKHKYFISSATQVHLFATVLEDILMQLRILGMKFININPCSTKLAPLSRI